MEEEKYQVFISSPFRGLADQRKAAVQAVINWEHIPIALENFSPQVQRDFDVIKKAIEDCQIYILILGHRYGSIIENEAIANGRTISYTQFEFEQAIGIGLVPLVFMKSFDDACAEIKDDEEILNKQTEMDLIRAFHELIEGKGIFYRPWNDTTNLEEVCGRALKTAIVEKKVKLPGWIRAGEGKDTKKVQMALNNKFVLDMIDNINSFEKLDERCSIAVSEKETLAKYFRELFLNLIIAKKYSLFFESDSCPAFVAKEIGSAKKFAAAVKATKEENALKLYTNNILAFLELWMNDHLPVSMLPNSSPKEQYGASYGILDHLIDEDRTPDYDRRDLDEYTKDAIKQLRNSPDAIPESDNILLICSTSGVQIGKEHKVRLKNGNPDLQRLVDECYGFHAGSYKNIIFKRYLYSTGLPVVITMTAAEIDMEISPDRCHFIFDKRYTWQAFCKDHPLAFCIGCRSKENATVSAIFETMDFVVQSKIYGEHTGILAANGKFLDRVGIEIDSNADAVKERATPSESE